ncbi:hypothetical protein HMPREF0973_01392 [Prevotella veroralis F0319]|uniref:Uncharacterized protein n=1 Tax=Prevotella veroralis F0319 TaxID=649761 RepID=C9MP54_9BACT|nr:hypothetical protein HMPREF0973_01392 [Prevotella veroralis F0319]
MGYWGGQTRASVPTFSTYFQLIITIRISSREALLPLGEVGWGFQTRASVPTLRYHLGGNSYCEDTEANSSCNT